MPELVDKSCSSYIKLSTRGFNLPPKLTNNTYTSIMYFPMSQRNVVELFLEYM